MKYYTVFNVEQCIGLPVIEEEQGIAFDPIEKCEQVIRDYKDKPKIVHRGDMALYNPRKDIMGHSFSEWVVF